MSHEGVRLRAFLVDDEEPARDRLRSLLVEGGSTVVVGEAADGDAALEGIRKLGPDLVFLDIQMPGRTGLEVAALLSPPRPHVVFCTAFDDYALQAFELHAVDYLLKPVSRARLQKAVDRVRAERLEKMLMQQEFERAGEAQAGLCPRELPLLSTLEYVGRCRPARWVSGDYYDFIPLDADRMGIVVADVSGKGMAAGLFTAVLQGRLHTRLGAGLRDPAGLVSWLNQVFLPNREEGRFITLFLAIYDNRSRVLEFVNAGHLPPLLMRGGGEGDGVVRRLETGGPVLGILPDAEYDCGRLVLLPGDLLTIFTDGITEATDAEGRELGEETLVRLVRGAPVATPGELAGSLFRELERLSGDRPAEDDQTLVLLKGR